MGYSFKVRRRVSGGPAHGVRERAGGALRGMRAPGARDFVRAVRNPDGAVFSGVSYIGLEEPAFPRAFLAGLVTWYMGHGDTQAGFILHF